MELHGCFYVLANLPVWASLLIIYFLTGFVVDAGREYFEGFSYNVSHAARYGDVGLVVIIIMAANILHQNPTMPAWLRSGNLQWSLIALSNIIFVIFLFIEIKMQNKGTKRRIVDIYHNMVIVPLLAYLVNASLLLIFACGSLFEKIAACCFVLLWFGLCIYDAKVERLDQRSWLEKKGFTCILKN